MDKKIRIPGERYQTDIIIQTRKKSNISNVQEYELPPYVLYQVEELNKKYQGQNVTFVNNASPIYNCHGLTFGTRRSTIWDSKEIMKIIKEDDYVRIDDMEDVKIGDVIIYFGEKGDAEHSGVVIGKPPPFSLPLILSKWGPGREAVHPYSQCPYAPDKVEFYRVSK